MTTPKWAAGTLYLPGDLVQPQQAEPATQSALTNPGFETGDATGWTVTQTGGTGTASVASDSKFAGTYAGRWQGAAGTGHSGGVEAVWENATDATVQPGQNISAQVMFKLDDTGSSQNQAQARLHWYNASAVKIGESTGTLIRGNSGSWRQSSVSGSAPAGAATVRLAAWTTANASGGVRLDNATWNHVAPPSTAGLIYKAVQPDPGTSAEAEPDWPTTLGVQVIDNTVTWEAVTTSRVVWEASPILTSGSAEPTWPTTPGDFVSDGTIKWECVSRRVEDENCPNTKVVAILAGKVFAADGDIVRFSATANPLDWTSERDAGYLPTGLQQANANDMAVLNQYRSNLVAFNASSFQNWQADPDPEAMAILDQMDGIGSTWPKAAQAVSNELLFLSQLGVRSVSVAAGAENLAAGDIGSPIDTLVQAAIAADGVVPIATYYPGAGQYWLAMSAGALPNALTVLGDLPDAAVGDTGTYQYTSAGGMLPHTFAIASGSLPPGATMDAAGLVTYDYTTGGTYSWTVRVTDAVGATADVTDTAGIAAGYWWATTDNVSHLADVWQSSDLSAWTGPVARTPNVATSDYGPVSLGVNVALVGGTQATLERITDFDPAGGYTTSAVTLGAGIDRIRSFGDYAVALNQASNTYYTTANKGAAWTARTAPGTGRLIDVQRLDSGRWIALLSDGASTRFLYSDDAGEPVNWTSATGGVASTGGAIACNGTAAAYLGTNNQICRTTDGAAWTNLTNVPGATISKGRDACAIGDVMLIAAEGASSGYIRSTDAGQTWGALVATVSVIQRFDVGGDVIVATFPTVPSAGTSGGIYSTNQGASFADVPIPYATSGTDKVRYGYVRYVP